MELFAPSEAALPQVAEKILALAGDRRKITLTGDLGAGKTALSKAIGQYLGVREVVSSPTFSLVNEYTYTDAGGRERLLYHLDLYRLKDPEEAIHIGIETYLYDEHYCLIEWPEIIESWLPEDTLRITIEVLPDSSRKFLILPNQ